MGKRVPHLCIGFCSSFFAWKVERTLIFFGLLFTPCFILLVVCASQPFVLCSGARSIYDPRTPTSHHDRSAIIKGKGVHDEAISNNLQVQIISVYSIIRIKCYIFIYGPPRS